MAESEVSLLDQLVLAATTDFDNQDNKVKAQNVTSKNKEKHFLSNITELDFKNINDSKAKNSSHTLDSNLINLPASTKNKNLSLIHHGDTDSSDDEQNRDSENMKYNEYGREIRQLLPALQSKDEYKESSSSWKQKRCTPTSIQKTAKASASESLITDPFFGIRISKPLISSSVLEERMAGRTAVSMARVKQFVSGNDGSVTNCDWVVAGVIVQRSAVRTSHNGKQYTIWTLSDLKDDLKSVSMFLFKSAFKELWKTATGTVVGVLNPSLLEQRDGSKQEATLSVDNHQKVMLLGQSKDYGICKSKKKDGTQCTSFVNVNRCEFCLYHVRHEYQKCAGRSELQARFSGGGLTALRNKVLGKHEVFYAGKSYTALPTNKSKKIVEKDNRRLTELSKAGTVTLTTTTTTKQHRKGNAITLEVSKAQRLKDLEIIKRLNGSADITVALDKKTAFGGASTSSAITLNDSKQVALSVIAKLKAKCSDVPKSSMPTSNDKNDSESQENEKFSRQNQGHISSSTGSEKLPVDNTKQLDSSLLEQNIVSSSEGTELTSLVNMSKLKMLKNLTSSSTPTLSSSSVIDLNAPISRRKPDRAKLNALKWVQQNGPIKKFDSTTKKSGVKRFLENSECSQSKISKLEENTTVSDRFKKIMALTSKHADLLEQHDLDQQDKYFNKLESRERMEEKMLSTYKVECKAVRCLDCKYTSFSAAARCKDEKHKLRLFNAVKRFFSCAGCGHRTCALELVPLRACDKCGEQRWQRAAMMREKRVAVGNTQLSIRGGEQRYLNSVHSDANINLLLPEH